jgi:cytochrome c biogenesis protein
MSVSTQGFSIASRSTAVRLGVELLSSMRFAISLLTLICIASVIGTILKQNEPQGNYVNQFGPFWAEVFGAASLTSVYSAWWFLLILAFLVTSTSLCVIRNTPKIIADLKTYKEGMREQSLKAFGLRAEAVVSGTPEFAAQRIGHALVGAGWKVKLQKREQRVGEGWMLAAKAGAANKLGYIAAHSAIVLICIGGLFDGDLMVRAQMLFNGKTPFSGGGMIADVKSEHRLGSTNPTFRGNLMVAEGTQSNVAILNQPQGILLQELPFAIELKKFVVEHYSTGMPKLFASDIVIHDLESGAKFPQRVEVNHPASYKGVEIYQSSFDDGGSAVTLQAVPMTVGGKSFSIDGVIGSTSELARQDAAGKEKLTLEFTGLRVINVENFAGASGSAVDVRKVDLRESIESRLGAANKSAAKKELRNVGPSIGYKLRDSAGQAKEFNNYMLPVDTGDGHSVYLLGARETPSEPFRYLRIPADDQGGLDGFSNLHAALSSAALRVAAVNRYVARATDPRKPELVQQLTASTARALDLFAGAAGADSPDMPQSSGLQAVSQFLESRVPEAERQRAGEVIVRLLNGVILELMQLDRQQRNLPTLPEDDKTLALTSQMMLALSDAPFYPAPMIFILKDFKQVQASVFQVARAPGKYLVYLGCALLIVGIFAMLYVRERRIWIWFTTGSAAPGAPEGASEPTSNALMALSTNRKTMDSDKEFDHLRARLFGDNTPRSKA